MATLPGMSYVGPGNLMGPPDAATDKTDLSALFHDADYDVINLLGGNSYLNTSPEDQDFLKSLSRPEKQDWTYANVLGSLGIGLKSQVQSALGLSYDKKIPYDVKKKVLSDKYGSKYFEDLERHGYKLYSEGKDFRYFNHNHHAYSTMYKKKYQPKVVPAPLKFDQVEGPGVIQVDNHGGILPYDLQYYNLLPISSNIGTQERPRNVVKVHDASIKHLRPEHLTLTPRTGQAFTKSGLKMKFVNDNRLPGQHREIVVISKNRPYSYKSKKRLMRKSDMLKAAYLYAKNKLPSHSRTLQPVTDKRTSFILRRAAKKIIKNY